MKHCEKSSNCPYGNAFEKNLCAYKEDMAEYELCPLLLNNWEEIIDKISETTNLLKKSNNLLKNIKKERDFYGKK